MLRIRDAERGGVGLVGAPRVRFNDIERSLSKLKTAFSNRLLDSTKAFELVIHNEAETEGWPQSLKAVTAQSHSMAYKSNASIDNGPWRITLDFFFRDPLHILHVKTHPSYQVLGGGLARSVLVPQNSGHLVVVILNYLSLTSRTSLFPMTKGGDLLP